MNWTLVLVWAIPALVVAYGIFVSVRAMTSRSPIGMLAACDDGSQVHLADNVTFVKRLGYWSDGDTAIDDAQMYERITTAPSFWVAPSVGAR